MWKTLRCWILVGLAAFLTGCGSGVPPELETAPVKGKVLIGGKPPVKAEVRFKPKVPLNDPAKRSVEPYAFVGEDGSFEVNTYRDKDGAPLGEYSITIVWPRITIEGGEEIFGPDQLNGRFSNPNAPVATFTVVQGTNVIPDITLN